MSVSIIYIEIDGDIPVKTRSCNFTHFEGEFTEMASLVVF